MSELNPIDGDNLWNLYRDGQLNEVADSLRFLIECDKNDQLVDALPPSTQRSLFELLGLALHDLGRPFEAADAIERASLIAPVRDEVRIALASCYAQLKRNDLARELYLQLAISRRLSPSLMLQAAAGLEAIDAPKLAMQVCQWITEQDESFAQAYYDMSFYAARAGHPLYAIEALTQRAVRLDPANIHYRIGLVSLLIQLDRKSEAIKVFDEMDVERIQSICCRSCLSRVESVLREFGRDQAADDCLQRLANLKADESTPRSSRRWENQQ